MELLIGPNLTNDNLYHELCRIQHEGVPNVNTGRQGCGFELTFMLTYEVNYMNEFSLDNEFKLHGCGSGRQDGLLWTDDTTINCPRNMERYEGGEALSEITALFGEDHDTWNREFLQGWDKMVVNGYTEGQLVEGPEYSWLGYSFLDGGSFSDLSYPLVFTDNKKANPTIGNLQREKIRDDCLKEPDQCPPEFRVDHEDHQPHLKSHNILQL